MAYRRSLATRAKVFAQQRFTPSIPYLNHHEDRKNPHSDGKLSTFLQSRSYGVVGNNSTSLGFRDPRRSQFCHVPMTASGFLLARSMSTKIAEQIDIADILSNQTMEVVSSTQAAPVLSEVAIAAADCWLPVAAWQYAIHGIHVFTGLNWWASIVITTLVVKTLLTPIMINHLKVWTKISILVPKIREFYKLSGDEAPFQTQSLCKQHGISMFSPFNGFLIQLSVFVTSILAIRNMVDKVPSFKTGGASWFLDLTTIDTFFVLPCVNAYLFWIIREFYWQEALGGIYADQKQRTRVMALTVLLFPFMACMPKALLFHWITSNLFSLVYGIVINDPTVKQILKIPNQPPPPNPTGP